MTGPKSGGAISVESGTLTVLRSTFLNNHAKNTGGAIRGSGIANSVTFSRFVGNTATDGNAAGLFSNSGADVSNTSFEGNRCLKATCLGGGYYAGDVATATGLTFVNNFAAGSGGGLAARRSITLERSIFLGNHANDGLGLRHSDMEPAIRPVHAQPPLHCQRPRTCPAFSNLTLRHARPDIGLDVGAPIQHVRRTTPWPLVLRP